MTNDTTLDDVSTAIYDLLSEVSALRDSIERDDRAIIRELQNIASQVRRK